jgi:large subunit ribosomal protein L25
MAEKNQSTQLEVEIREPGHSRATRRLRRAGRVPGVLYGGGEEPISFSVEERVLRHALAARGAVIELSVGGQTTPVVLKDIHRDPVRGETLHVDLFRVDLSKPIEATVALHLVGADDAPGVREGGGTLEQITREIQVEALPSDIPEFIELDVSDMEINDNRFLSAVTPPSGVTLLDDLEETVIAILAPPRVEDVDDEIESETELVGDSGAAASGGDDAQASDDASADGDSGGE